MKETRPRIIKSIRDLIPDAHNANKGTEYGLQKIEQSLRDYGAGRSILVDRNGRIIAGNKTAETFASIGLDEVEVISTDGSRLVVVQRLDLDLQSDPEARELGLIDNYSGEVSLAWDSNIILQLAGEGINVLKVFDQPKLDEIRQMAEAEAGKTLEALTSGLDLSGADEDLEDHGMVFTLKDDVKFPSSCFYDFPTIREDLILDMPAPTTWAGPDATEGSAPYFYNYHSDSTLGLDFSKTVIGFYVDDVRFEGLFHNAAECAKRFINKKIVGLVAPNYSTYFDWPRAIRIYNIFRSRWVARYMQEAGIRIIPDIAGGIEDLDYMFDGLPVGTPICLQAHQRFKSDDAIAEKKQILETTFERLRPSRTWVYATPDRLDLFPVLKEMNPEFIIPRAILRSKTRALKNAQ